MPKSVSRLKPTEQKQMRELAQVALGQAAADLAIINGAVVNVYTGELLQGQSVLIKGDKIAYIGKNASQSIGSSTRIVDATGKTLIPGLIDGHIHIEWIYSVGELVKYALMRGTTTIVTELLFIAFPLGYQGIVQYLRVLKNQPMKFFATLPAMLTISPTAEKHSLTLDEYRRLLKRKDVLALGESFWAMVIDGNERMLDLFTETIKAGKKIDGHSSGAKDNRLQAYAAHGVSSCHEPTTAEEVLERLRLGMYVLIREGEIRRELDAISKIKDEKIDFRRLALATDGVGPNELINEGYMDFVVQKAINLGISPILAIQMATINPAQRFGIDGFIGGIAPGKYADIVIVPDLHTIKPESVISNGQIVFEDGQLLVPPVRNVYPESMRNSINLPGTFKAEDFTIRVTGNRRQAKVRVIDQVTGLLTREAILDMPVAGGHIHIDVDKDILKVAAIERTYVPGKTFVGLIRGVGLKRGAIAVSFAWDACDIAVVGADEADMAQSVNRIKELRGGIIVCAGGKVMAELAMPVAGMFSTEPLVTVDDRLRQIQQAAVNLGTTVPDIRMTVAVLTSAAIPYLRLCEDGLVDIKQNRFVDLIVD